MRVHLHNGPARSTARGPLKPAFELYSLWPTEPPVGAESRLLWDMGQAVQATCGRRTENREEPASDLLDRVRPLGGDPQKR